MTTEKPAPAGEKSEPETKAPDQSPEPTDTEDVKKANVPYFRFAEVLGQKKAAEEELKNLVAELVAELPEHLRPLVPSSLSPAAQAAWIKQAKEAGLFAATDRKDNPAPVKELDTKRPGGKPPADLSNLNSSQLLSIGYQK